MSMKPSLQVRLSQHLALTPQLQQSIRLLQLSTLELHQEIEQMLEENPFLDVDDDHAPMEFGLERVSASADTSAEREKDRLVEREHSAEAADPASTSDEPAAMDGEFGGTERDDWENGTERDDFDGTHELPALPGSSTAASGDGDFEPADGASQGPTLQEHLHQQLLGMRLSDEDRAAVMVLIESLNDDGYLADALVEIVQRLGADGDDDDAAAQREELVDRLRCALKWLQSMEPAGVGATGLGDCLQIQLRLLPPSPVRRLAITVCGAHLELLARRDMKRLMAATDADEDSLRAAQALILSCEPKPGRPFARAEANIIVPDVIVLRIGRGFKATLNPDVMPKLRINDFYAQAIRGQRNGSAQGLSGRLQEARWFMKNILQRFDTILRVSQAIVERQKSFFSHGAIAMKPLVLREIADELGLHESTISRVTTAKYMTTPFGTYELKYFFGSSLNTDVGGNASSTAVRALIRQLVDAENAARPLSDSQLAEMLAEQGITVARRTVAKYREALKIAPANLRKNL